MSGNLIFYRLYFLDSVSLTTSLFYLQLTPEKLLCAEEDAK